MLALTLHGRGANAWPTPEALLAARSVLEAEPGAATYPEVLVNEALFMRLPLWDASTSEHISKKIIFGILACFEDESRPRPDPGTAVVSARRLFAYLGAGTTPAEGLRNSLGLLLTKSNGGDKEMENDGEGQVLVTEVWKLIFSCGARSQGVAKPPPELEPFCRELVPPPPPPEPPVPAKKGQPPPTPPEPVPPPPAEETWVSRDATYLLRQPAILKALCTHGSLLSRKRALQMLFPSTVDGPQLRNAAEAREVAPLTMLVPVPEPIVEEGS
jgi:hypothetical protein